MTESYTVQISTALINQLARDDDKARSKPKKPKSRKVVPKPQTHELEKGLIVPPSSSIPGWQPQPPVFLPVAPPLVQSPAVTPEIESIRAVSQEAEEVLKKLDKREAAMAEELNRRARELREKEFKLPFQNPVPCAAERADCVNCYKSNANDPLKCSDAVKRFADCTRQVRVDAHLKREQ